MKNIFDNGFYDNKTLNKAGFNKIGKNVKISKSCLIIGLKNISLGSNIRIDAFTSIIANKGFLKLGNNIHIGGHGHLLCSGGITIKNNCTFSSLNFNPIVLQSSEGESEPSKKYFDVSESLFSLIVTDQ